MEMIMLRNTQGIHAPLRLAMELKSAEKVGRLPFLPSSNVMRDVILGRDEDIGYVLKNTLVLLNTNQKFN